MPFIQNVSRYAVEQGLHKLPGAGGAVLVQISDPDVEHPVPKHSFSKVYQFKFLDIEDDQPCVDESWRPSQEHANAIAKALKEAYCNGMDVIVHCHMGVCRSGAVAAAGAAIGFDCSTPLLNPNSSLKRRLLIALDLAFDPERSAFN